MSRTVLVVDDDRQMVQTFSAILRKQGWETVAAYDGLEAVKAASERRVDVVLMDVRMPGMNGVEALRSIRRRRPLMPVILMTAYSSQDLLSQAERDGVLSILPKPVAWPRLMALLEGVLKTDHAVLIVDDDPAFLGTLTEVLAEGGRHVHEATTLEGALALLSGAEPSIVVLDLKLDSTGPLDAIAAVRDSRPGVVIILCSGYPSLLDDTLASAPADAVYASFQKPFDPSRLVALLDELAPPAS